MKVGTGNFLMEGQTVSHYRILKKIGQGGMGEVYLAEDITLERKIALKFLPEALAQDEIAPHRFLREAKAAAAIDHPFICKIYEIGETEQRRFIAMEYVDGETLKDRLKRESLSYREVLRIGSEIAEALQRAHESGIVHRDLKPSNIMLTKEGRVKVMDFGLAKRVVAGEGTTQDITSYMTKEGVTLGTLPYMSPEQLRGEPVDTRSDIFSFGIMLYEMLMGHHPFYRERALDTAAAILNLEPDFPKASQAGPGVSLHDILQKMLTKDVAERLQSIEETHATLAQLLEKAAPSVWKRRWRSLLVGMTALAALVTIALYFLFVSLYEILEAGEITQLTRDGEEKQWFHLVTDGRVVYYSQVDDGFAPDYGNIIYVSAEAGGSPTHLDVWPGEKRLTLPLDISPDSTSLLVASVRSEERSTKTDFYVEGIPLWIVPLPIGAGVPKPLGDICANRAFWSPDGQRIAYSSQNALYVMTADGKRPKKVFEAGCEEDGDCYLYLWSWSPDGQRLCYTVFEPPFSLWEIRADGLRAPQRMVGWTEGALFGQWCPDSDWLIFRSKPSNRNAEIYAFPVRSSFLDRRQTEPTPLTSGVWGYYGFRLDPNGRRLFALMKPWSGEVVEYNATIDRWLPTEFRPETSPSFVSFSEDGEWVAYSTFPEGRLWISRVDGTRRQALTEPESGFVTHPVWSPDGSMLAYAVSREFHLTENRRIHVVFVDDGSHKGPFLENYDQYNACWSPQGRLLISGVKGGSYPLTRIDVKTGETGRIDGSEGMWECCWSNSGRYIATHQPNSDQLILYDFSTQAWLPLTESNGEMLSWSLNDDHLYYLNVNSKSLYSFDPEEQESHKVANFGTVSPNLPGTRWWYAFHPDGKLLTVEITGRTEIYAMDLTMP